MQVNGLIVAAGEGTRIGQQTAKPFLPIQGRPMVLHTLDRFAESRSVKRVIVMVAAGEVERCLQLVGSDPGLAALTWEVYAGGATRQDSVRSGLTRLDGDCEVVVIHDGARPFVSPALIDRCVDEALKGNCVVTGVRVQDTIKLVSAGRRVLETPARDLLWSIQTPQVFPAGVIREAYLQGEQRRGAATDDATLVEQLGRAVYVLDGERTNIKVTYPQDLIFAEMLLRSGKVAE